MYEQLGTAMEILKRDPKNIRLCYGWGAALASRTKDPIALIAACDELLLHKYYEIDLPKPAKPVVLTDLLDQAMAAAPWRAEPILMSFVLAESQKDPARATKAAETLLSLGWPGMDGTWRVEIPKRLYALAKTLREDGREDEAKGLEDRIPKLEARDLVIRLTWEGDAMLELSVDEPLDSTASHFRPRTVFGGALVKEGSPKDREVVYVCPRGFDGEYIAKVGILYNDEKKPARVATIEAITHEGTPDEKVVTRKVSLEKPQPVQVTLTDGRRKEVLPYEKPLKIATPRADLLKPKGGVKPANTAPSGPPQPKR
jgi:hypothetical protein